MKKQSFGMLTGAQPGLTVGSLEQAIAIDQRISNYEKQQAIMQIRQDLGGVSSHTPLSSVLHRIGGGVLGLIIAKYFGMGTVGQILSSVAGYGMGKVVSDFYDNNNGPRILGGNLYE